jgi:two-component system sensor histidine kinase BaeS
LAPTGQSLVVEVSDTGSGIAADDLPRIFDRFFRGEGSRPSASASAGLGLAIVKNILELHGTEIRVASTVGAGTTFRFEIPARSPVREDVGALLRRLRGPIRLRPGC